MTTPGIRATRRAVLAAAALACAGCAERDRVRFDCDGIIVAVSTQQRVPGWAGGEENVYVELAAPAGVSARVKIDNNGRWLDRLGASVARDRSWVRFHVRDRGAPRQAGTSSRTWRSSTRATAR